MVSAAAETVKARNQGSADTVGPSANIRQMCATVISPKTAPVVIKYVLMS
jgi:hypothetical protein